MLFIFVTTNYILLLMYYQSFNWTENVQVSAISLLEIENHRRRETWKYNITPKKKRLSQYTYMFYNMYICITRDTLCRTESKERKEKKMSQIKSGLSFCITYNISNIHNTYMYNVYIYYIYIYHFVGRLFRGWSVLHLINPLIFSPLAGSTITFFASIYISKTISSQCARLQYFVGHDFYRENVSW